jgi:apolipoprotein N-acyltransferase
MSLILTACVCSALGIVFPELWFLAPLALALFFSLLRGPSVSMSRAATYGLMFGCASAGAGTVWFWDTVPLSFLGIDSIVVQFCAVGMTWAYVSLSLAAPVPLAALVLRSSGRLVWFPCISAVVWALTEVARMWAFACTTWGPQSFFGPHFSAAAVGYSLTESPILLQLADPWGLDGLNCIVAFFAAAGSQIPVIWKNTRVRYATALQVVAVILVLAMRGSNHREPDALQGARPLRFALIHEQLETARDESTHKEVLEELTSAAAALPPVDVIVLPEELGLTSIFWSRDEYQSFVKQALGEREVLILNSRNDLFPAEEKNQFPDAKKLVYDSTKQGEVGRYIKQMLMPLGEYAPAFTKTFFSVIQDPQLQAHLDDVALPNSERSRELTVAEFRGVRIGGLLCSDLFSPYLYRVLARDHKADVLINLANHLWFHGSKTLSWKTVQMARVHAVQNRLPMLISNNMASALALDAFGKVITQSSSGQRGVNYAVMSPVPGHSS